MNKIDTKSSSFIQPNPKKYPKLKQNYPIANLCWFNVGGTVQWFYKPSNIQELQQFIVEFAGKIPMHVVGAGSNVIFKDGELKGALIRLGKEFNYIEPNATIVDNKKLNSLKVGAATLDFNLAIYSRESCVEGLEFFAGIPGTIGGAIAMNAGSYGSEAKDVLLNFTAINLKTGRVNKFNAKDIEFGYRHNPLGNEWLFLEAEFIAKSGDKVQIASKIKQIQDARQSTQPVKTKTGGSTFKNPKGLKTWQLIDDAGCRGCRVGGCCISEMHCNFIVNDRGAKASDIIELIEAVQQKVLDKTGIALQPEIKVIG